MNDSVCIAGLHGPMSLDRQGDVFEPWDAEGDAVIPARLLHDWDNGPVLRLLRHARRTLPYGGRVFVVEMVLAEGGATGGLCDLHLLAVSGGRECTACGAAINLRLLCQSV